MRKATKQGFKLGDLKMHALEFAVNTEECANNRPLDRNSQI